MNTKVTEYGVNIPKQWLEYVDEVEIYKKNDVIMVIPIKCHFDKPNMPYTPFSYLDEQPNKSTPQFIADPIFNLGKAPIDDDLFDASINHDKYIYD